MLYDDRINFSVGMDVNETNESKEFDICCHWYFIGSTFQPHVCNRCQDALMMSMNLGGIAILSIHGTDYSCLICRISKNEAINLMQNTDLTEKVKHSKT